MCKEREGLNNCLKSVKRTENRMSSSTKRMLGVRGREFHKRVEGVKEHTRE